MRLDSIALGALLIAFASSCGSKSSGSLGAGGVASSGPGSGTTAATSGGSRTGSASSASGGGSGAGGSPTIGAGGGEPVLYGQPYQGGQYNLGPVDYAETQWHNACAPGSKYPASVQKVEGSLLAGLWGGIPNVAGYCDACIWVTTAKGKSALLRVVTYGQTSTNSIDVSQSAYDILNDGEYPRDMTWQLAECPDSGPMLYEFQTCASQWWTSLWVRNARVPVAKVEVKSPNHASYVELTRGSDGTLTDNGGFGMGTFSIRTTGVDGQQVVDTFSWPSAGLGGAFLTGKGNFP